MLAFQSGDQDDGGFSSWTMKLSVSGRARNCLRAEFFCDAIHRLFAFLHQMNRTEKSDSGLQHLGFALEGREP